MSGPNDNFDPKQVAALDPAAVEGFVADALSAIAAAGSTTELKQVRLAHAGDTSPLALANREIGALPPQPARTSWPSSSSPSPSGPSAST
jgi:phenylalanyl-tRNA synthetase alpha chain